MTRATLDRKRPHAMVYGSVPYSYEQDSKLFNHLGLECKEDGSWDHDDAELLTEEDAKDSVLYQDMAVGPLNHLLKKRSGKGMAAGVTKDTLIAALMRLDQKGA